MSTLTQFTGGGDSILGEVVEFNARTKGFSFTDGTREYMQTGVIKEYSSAYAPLVASNTLCGISVPTDPLHKDWSFLSYSNYWNQTSSHAGAKFFQLGTDQASGLPYKHICLIGSNYAGAGSTWFKHKYGVNFANTVTAQQDDDGGGVHSVHLFNNRLVFSGYRSSMDTDANGFSMFWSTGANSPTQNATRNYQTTWNWGYTPIPAENQTTALLWTIYEYARSGWSANAFKTTDGVNFTSLNITSDLRYPGRFTWSTVGNCWIMVTWDGRIMTSADGQTWTQRTVPVGMPTSIGHSMLFGSSGYRFCVDHPTQGTIICLDSNDTTSLYFLKTTDGINYTLLNAASANPHLRNYFWGASGYQPRLMRDGDTLIMYNVSTTNGDTAGSTIATSTDFGQTWTLHPLIFNNNPPSNTLQTAGGIYLNFMGLEKFDSKWYGIFMARNQYGTVGTKAYELTNRGGYFSGTPTHIGVTQGLSFATGSSLSPYVRIK